MVSENHGSNWILETGFCSNVLALLHIHDYVFTKICECFIRQEAAFGIVLKFRWRVNGNLCFRRKLKVSSLSVVKDSNEVYKCDENFWNLCFYKHALTKISIIFLVLERPIYLSIDQRTEHYSTNLEHPINSEIY